MPPPPLRFRRRHAAIFAAAEPLRRQIFADAFFDAADASRTLTPLLSFAEAAAADRLLFSHAEMPPIFAADCRDYFRYADNSQLRFH
jgi:hypothetical protein